jgi:hypothetical protein
MRIVFSIIHNGLHHLHHNTQYENILKSCDKWIVVEGASRSNGSTKWCNEFPDDLHLNGGSIDGTREFLEFLSKETDKLIYIPSNGFWQSKDHQVNRAIEEVKKITNRCWLWEIDIDEQWELEQMDAAEKELFGKLRQPGTVFSYRNSDPEMIALMIAKVILRLGACLCSLRRPPPPGGSIS